MIQHGQIRAAVDALAEEFAGDKMVAVSRGVPGVLADEIEVNISLSLLAAEKEEEAMDGELLRPKVALFIQSRQNEVLERFLWEDYWQRSYEVMRRLDWRVEEGAQLEVAQIEQNVYSIIATDYVKLD